MDQAGGPRLVYFLEPAALRADIGQVVPAKGVHRAGYAGSHLGTLKQGYSGHVTTHRPHHKLNFEAVHMNYCFSP